MKRSQALRRAHCLFVMSRGIRRDSPFASLSRITAAITQVAANKLKIKIDAKYDLGSSHCYPDVLRSVGIDLQIVTNG